jgi:hypothetical protein
LYRLYKENNPEEKRDVFMLLEEHDPQWSKDIKELFAGQRRMADEQVVEACKLLVNVLRAAK